MGKQESMKTQIVTESLSLIGRAQRLAIYLDSTPRDADPEMTMTLGTSSGPRSSLRLCDLPKEGQEKIIQVVREEVLNAIELSVVEGRKKAEEMLLFTNGKYALVKKPTKGLQSVREDGVPRRNDLSLNTPLELKFIELNNLIEKLGAHTRLTDTQVLLSQAKDALADFLESEVVESSE